MIGFIALALSACIFTVSIHTFFTNLKAMSIIQQQLDKDAEDLKTLYGSGLLVYYTGVISLLSIPLLIAQILWIIQNSPISLVN